MDKQQQLNLAAQCFEDGKQFNKHAKYKEAIEVFKKASAIYEKQEVWERWITINIHLAWTNKLLGNYDKALKYATHTIKVVKKYFGENDKNIAQNLNIIGLVYSYKGDIDAALSHIHRALKIFQKSLGETNFNVGNMFNNLGMFYNQKGNNDKAISYHKRAFAIFKKELGENHSNTARSLTNIGLCYAATGDYSSAINYHQQAIRVFKKNFGNKHPDVARGLNNLALSYINSNEYSKAITCIKEAVIIYEEYLGKTHLVTASSLNNLGICYQDTHNYEEAIKCYKKSLKIKIYNFGKENTEVAHVLNNLCACYFKKGDYTKAMLYGEKSINTWRLIGKVYTEKIDCLINLAYLSSSKSDYKTAINYYQEAIGISDTNINILNWYQNPNIVALEKSYFLLKPLQYKAQTLYWYHGTETKNLKTLQAALSTIQIATDLVSQMRQSYKAEGSKHTLAENATNTYNLALKIATKTVEIYSKLTTIPQQPEFSNIPYTTQGCKTLAFSFTEQSKAILLLSSLKDNEAKATAGIPAKLLEKEKQLKIELNYLDKSIATQEAKGNKKDEELLAKFQSQYFDYKQQYNQLIEQFETNYPEYYRLKYKVKTASVKDVQQYLSPTAAYPNNNNKKNEVSEKTALISYHIAENQIYIFAITAATYHIATITKPSDFSGQIEDLQTAINVSYPELFIKASSSLFNLLLQTVWERIKNAKNLIIIPHNELYYIPFDALINLQQLSELDNFADLPYLIKDYNISYHYSATMLLYSHKQQQQTSQQTDSFFGLAPIQFGGNGNKASKPGYVVKSSKQQRQVVLKSSGDKGAALQDLAETEVEVKEIYRQFEQQGKEAIALFYDQANKENLQHYVGNYKYVLISTHGYLQEAGKTILQGIHLAPILHAEEKELIQEVKEVQLKSTNNEQTALNDYILHTSETYQLKLNADLVVLSSCESGIGNLLQGEGMMALNRGFLYAGAANIIYSLFKVPQDSTSKLTQALFTHILKGDSYAAALRKAKLDLISSEFAEPRDWSGFALIGR